MPLLPGKCGAKLKNVSGSHAKRIGKGTVALNGYKAANDTTKQDIQTVIDNAATEADKLAEAKRIIQEALNGYTARNNTTREDIQSLIDTTLTNAGITDVTADVGDLTKIEAAKDTEGSISGNILIVSKNDAELSDSRDRGQHAARLAACADTCLQHGNCPARWETEGRQKTAPNYST